MNEITVKNLVKVYNNGGSTIKALDGVSFDLSFGELTVILGPSGSGKSTLLNILGGMEFTTKGSVNVVDRNITNLKEKELVSYRRNDIGFVFQFYNLLPNLTALENVQLCENKGSSINATQALELVGLGKRFKNFPSQLSGGEQQRVSIARALVKSPKLFLCDEPTGALDSKTGRKIITLLQKLTKEANCAVVIVTHNAQLTSIADRVIELSDGKIISNRTCESPLNAENIDY